LEAEAAIFATGFEVRETDASPSPTSTLAFPEVLTEAVHFPTQVIAPTPRFEFIHLPVRDV
jgi:hypothetical protein